MPGLGSGFGDVAMCKGIQLVGGRLRKCRYEDVGVENLFHVADEAVWRELKDVDPSVTKRSSSDTCNARGLSQDENVALVSEELIGAEVRVGNQRPAFD